jgi:hypothetical protein
MIALISSSLTLFSDVFYILKTFKRKIFETVRSQTNGDVIIDKTCMGLATIKAIRSGNVIATDAC